MKGDILDFFMKEAFVYEEEQKAFPNAIPRTLSEHLQKDLDARMAGFYKLGRRTNDTTYEGAKGDASSALNKAKAALTGQAAKAIEQATPKVNAAPAPAPRRP